ncbi:MAG: hypothetical protein ACLSGF_10410 [Alistipes onderdonkii]
MDVFHVQGCDPTNGTGLSVRDHLKENISRYDIICGIGDDAPPRFPIMKWEYGLMGRAGRTHRTLKKVNTTPEQQHFYALHLRVIRAVQGWIQRHVDEARRLAATCGDPGKKRCRPNSQT